MTDAGELLLYVWGTYMKKILSLVLAVVIIMAMAVPAFAASEDEVAPCALCNGSHTYEEALEQVSYSCDFPLYWVMHWQCCFTTKLHRWFLAAIWNSL